MPDEEFDAEAYARQAAALLSLPLDPARLPGVAQNLMLARRMAATVFSIPLGIEDEPAPVFNPGNRS